MNFRLILDPPRPASLNMAIDEMLMAGQRTRQAAHPTLRFYTWSQSAITCGYFQKTASLAARFKGQEIVRRLTGGGLVQHGQDLTFSLTLSDDHPFFSGSIQDSYLKVSEALRIGLQPYYPGLDYAECGKSPSPRGQKERICFDEPVCFDLLWKGKKVTGSSQRHSEGAVLYQSSLFFLERPEIVAMRVVDGFRSSWKADFATQALSDSELEAARAIERERYASADWRFLEASFLSKQSGQL